MKIINNLIFTLKKTAYRLGRLLYILRKNNIGKWISILFKKRKEILFESIILRCGENDKYRQEVAFLNAEKKFTPFPYKPKQMENVVSGYDEIKKLPYVIHKNRRLYFPCLWTMEEALWSYKNFIESEKILGKNVDEKAPHRYQTESFCIKKDDVLLDIGCAEALFSLDAIAKVKKVFLFECDEMWFKPLEATFEKELAAGKVILIKKYVGKKNAENTVTIDAVLKNEHYDSLFIKMDIEGMETEVVKSCKSMMQTDKEIKFSCCTYHKSNDAKTLKRLFEKNKYYTEFSEGYMLFTNDKLIKYPYFRRGVIRASNIDFTTKTLVKIVIPIYKNTFDDCELKALNRCCKILSQYPTVFVKPQSLDTSNLKKDYPQIEIENFSDEYFTDLTGYNRLMLSSEFYKRFSDCRYILIYQLDAYVFRDELKEWCNKNYDYVGAPWLLKPKCHIFFRRLFLRIKSFRRLIAGIPVKKLICGDKVGNGGLSLRKVSSHIQVANEKKSKINYYIEKSKTYSEFNEDVFWATQNPKFKYPNPREALSFSIDENPELCFNVNGSKLPFGCHGWSKSDRSTFWHQFICSSP